MERATAGAAATAALITSTLLAGCTGAGGTGGTGATSSAATSSAAASPAATASGGSGSGSTTSASTKGVQLGAVLPNASDPFWVSVACGISAQAKAQGATVTFKNAPDASTETLASNLDAVASSKPDGVIVAGRGNTFNARIEAIQQAGAPVVSVNSRNTPPVEYAGVISSGDNDAFAKFVAKDVGTSGSVLILGGVPGLLDGRWEPMASALKKAAPGVKIAGPVYDGLNRSKAASAASSLINTRPDLRAIYTVTGLEGAAAASAVAKAHKQGAIKVYTYDATPEIVQGLQSGTVRAVLTQSPSNQGREAARLAIDYARSGKSGAVQAGFSKKVELPLKILTKDSMSSAGSKAYTYASTCK